MKGILLYFCIIILIFKITERGNEFSHDIEYLMVEILRNKEKNTTFLCIYTNLLDYTWNTIVCDFFNFAFQNSILPVINRPTTVTKTNATVIDQILTNSVIDSPLHSGIIKTDISDHFAVFY